MQVEVFRGENSYRLGNGIAWFLLLVRRVTGPLYDVTAARIFVKQCSSAHE